MTPGTMKDAQLAVRSRGAAERYMARYAPDALVATFEPFIAAPSTPEVPRG